MGIGLLAVVLPSGGTVALKRSTKVSVTFVDCQANIGKNSPLRMTAIDLRSRKAVLSWRGIATRAATKTATFDLSPGPYEFLAASEDCGQSVRFMLPDKQTLAVVMFASTRTKVIEGAGAIGGTLPFEGASVSIVYKETKVSSGGPTSPDGYYEVPAVVSGRAYLAGDAPVGSATVRLYDGSHTRWIDVGTVALDSNAKPWPYVEKDIGTNDVARGTAGGV
jgi:hypothetical protein